MSTDTAQLIAPTVDWRRDEIALDTGFPANRDLIAVVVDGATPEAAEIAAATLAAPAGARPRAFPHRPPSRRDAVPAAERPAARHDRRRPRDDGGADRGAAVPRAARRRPVVARRDDQPVDGADRGRQRQREARRRRQAGRRARHRARRRRCRPAGDLLVDRPVRSGDRASSSRRAAASSSSSRCSTMAR